MNRLNQIFFIIVGFSIVSSCILFDYESQSENLSPTEIVSIEQKADSLHLLGKRLREQSSFKNALEYQSQALECAEQINDTIRIIENLNQLGTTMRRVGRMERALSYHYQALAFTDAYHEDTSSIIQHCLQVTLNGIGNVHLTLGNDQIAEEYFRKSLIGDIAISNHRGMAINYANLGTIFENKDQLDSARYYYERSLDKNEFISSAMGIGLCHKHFGDIYSKLYQLEEAEKEYRKSAIIMSGINDEYHSLAPLLALTQNLVDQGRLAEARLYADTSLAVAERIHSYESLYEATSNKAKLLEKAGDLRGAYDYLKQSAVWKDSLYRPNSNNSISEICLNFEQQQGQRQMQKLRDIYEADQEIQKTINVFQLALIVIIILVLIVVYYAAINRNKRIMAIRNLSNMKDTFFNNFSNEFRSPIQSILGTIEQLKANKTDDVKIENIEKKCTQILHQVDLVTDLSRFAGGNEIEPDWKYGDVVKYLRTLISAHQEDANDANVKVVVSSHPQCIEMDYSPIYLQKISSNLLWYAIKGSPAGGIVTVDIKQVDKHLIIIGADSGENFSFEDKQHAFEPFYQSKSPRLNGSMGLCLPFLHQLVHRMGGIVSLKDNEPRGVKIEMIVPLRHQE